MAPAPLITLNNGNKIPQLGLGTYKSREDDGIEAIKYAIDVGYRHFDTAFFYQNEREVGQAIREKIADGTVKREEIFVTTKLWNTFHELDQVVPMCKKSLENLGLDYVDLFLIHWPVAMKLCGELNFQKPFEQVKIIEHDFLETWKGMEQCVELGLAKNIGLSNFNSKQITRILENATINPVANQVEVNPHLNQKKLIKFCKEHDIMVIAYTPFGVLTKQGTRPGQPEITFEHPTFANLAKKYGKTSQQIILRYLIQSGTIPIPKSANKERIKLNLEIFDFELNGDDIKAIDLLNADFRAVPASELAESPNHPFHGVEF